VACWLTVSVRPRVLRTAHRSKIMAFLQIGNRGGKVLVHDGYRYQKNRAINDKIFWRCWNKNCRAPLQTAFFDVDVDEQNIVVLQVIL
jgi:hypothetical protein